MSSSSSAARPLRRLLAAHKGLFVGVATFSLVINLLMLAPALYMLQVYDRVLTSRNITTLVVLSGLLVGFYVLEAFLEWVRSRALVRGSAALDQQLAPRVFDAAFARTLGGQRGSAAQAMGDLTSLRQFMTGKGLFAFLDAPWTPVFIAVLFLLHPWLGWFGIAAALMLLALAGLNEWATAKPLNEANRESQQATHTASANLRNAEAIEAMGMLGALRRQWLRRQSRVLVLQSRASDRAGGIAAVSRFSRMVFQSGILGLGALLVLDGALTPGAMIAASILLGRALAPVDQAMASWRSLVAARGAYSRLNDLLAAHPPCPSRTALPRPAGLVQVDHLVAGPPGARIPVLKGLKFGATPGMLVAVMGPSASGKSTLARALVGVWPPISGTVRLDGADVHQWDKEELGHWLGYLPQDVELFEGTVAENIARFRRDDGAQVVRAAQRAGVHELILRLPQGYETPIGEGGVALSGGQRQRIGLARALYGEPALVVLDEPNAHLDDAGDAALVQALQHLRLDKVTVFVVTHRPHVLSIADAVMVLSQGQIQTYGPRELVLQQLQGGRRMASEGDRRLTQAASESAA